MILVVLVNYNSAHHHTSVRKVVAPAHRAGHRLPRYRGRQCLRARRPRRAGSAGPSFSEVEVCYSEVNLGFAGGNMLGYRTAAPKLRPDYVFLLNNDTLLRTDCLTELAALLAARPAVGLAAPQMFGEAGEWTESYGFFPTLADKLLGRAFCRTFGLGHHPPRPAQGRPPALPGRYGNRARHVRGRGRFLSKLAAWMSNYFLYCEEEDLAWQVWQAGRQVVVVPSSEFTHLGGRSSTPNYGLLREFYISLAYFLRKNFSPTQAWLVRWVFIVKLVFRARRGRHYLRLARFLAQDAPMTASIRPVAPPEGGVGQQLPILPRRSDCSGGTLWEKRLPYPPILAELPGTAGISQRANRLT